MDFIIFIPLVVGIATVLQGGFNRQISGEWGLGPTLLLNELVLITTALAGVLFFRFFPESMPEILRPKGTFSSFSWWYVLPGIMGLTIVLGIPFAISRVGALKMFIGLIAAQLIMSALWDLYIEKIPVTGARVAGACLAFLSAALAAFKS